ncbi:hypothetical protein KCU78_g6244, partial [Aureobasidium melanogenum]
MPLPTPAPHPLELFVDEQSTFYVDPATIKPVSFPIVRHYAFGSRVNPSDTPLLLNNGRFIRRILTRKDDLKLRPLAQSDPIPGQLEIDQFGRFDLIQKFDKSPRVISVPLLFFIDGFGLYRNMYRTLVGFYLINGALSFKERARRANVLPMCLGPHGSNLEDVVDAFGALMYSLDSGVELNIGGKEPEKTVKNSGMKSQRANRGCRSCYATKATLGDMGFNKFEEGRFHFEALRQREAMGRLNRAAMDKFARDWGLDTTSPVLHKLCPALDLIVTRPADPAHSEYNGISKLLHHLLIETILTKNAAKEYSNVLRSFPFPPGWAHLPNPQYHLGSYRLSEHGRWSIIAPVLLRLWLRDAHIRPGYASAVREALKVALDHLEIKAGHRLPTSALIAFAFSSIAESNMLLMSNSLTNDKRANFEDGLLNARLFFQKLNDAASTSVRSSSRASSRASTREPSTAPGGRGTRGRGRGRGRGRSSSHEDVVQSVEDADEEDPAIPSKRSQQYQADAARPNVHVGIHWKRVMDRFALTTNCNVLIGEDQHSHPELTKQFQTLHGAVPGLLQSLLPKSEHLPPEEDEEAISPASDEAHGNVQVLSKLKADYCRTTLGLPVRANQMDRVFVNALTAAYATDYSMENVTAMGARPVKWWKKAAFDDPVSERRIVFSRGDFIYYREQQLGRIDQIYTHEVNVGRIKVFFLVTAAVFNRKDSITGLPLFKKLYVVPITVSAQDEYARGASVDNLVASADLLHVDWDI